MTHSVPFCSVAQSCPTLCDPMNRSTPGLPVHHQLPEFTQTHIHQVRDFIHPSHPPSSPSPPAPSPSQHQSLFQSVNSSHEVAKVRSFSFSIIPSKEHPGLISFAWLRRPLEVICLIYLLVFLCGRRSGKRGLLTDTFEKYLSGMGCPTRHWNK